MVRVRVDAGLCSGHALCFAYAQDELVEDEQGYNVTGTVELPESAREAVEKAARACPERAITVTDA